MHPHKQFMVNCISTTYTYPIYGGISISISFLKSAKRQMWIFECGIRHLVVYLRHLASKSEFEEVIAR